MFFQIALEGDVEEHILDRHRARGHSRRESQHNEQQSGEVAHRSALLRMRGGTIILGPEIPGKPVGNNLLAGLDTGARCGYNRTVVRLQGGRTMDGTIATLNGLDFAVAVLLFLLLLHRTPLMRCLTR